MKKTIFIIGLSLLLQSCVKQVDWNVQDGKLPILIVDAILTDEVKSQQVSLTYPVSQLNQPPRPVSGASVIISNEDSVWTLIEKEANPGIYMTSPSFFASPEKNYTLLVSLDNNIYSARATMLPGSYFPELIYTKNEDNNLYYIDWVANAFSTRDAAMWELIINWSMVPGYENLDSLATHARMMFYTLPTLDVSEVFAPQMDAINFPAGTIITERRYSITPVHAEFIRELLLETDWTGGLFNVAAANVTTNLSNGALGFFGLCAVTQLSVTVATATTK
jgi:hypothetical protein